MNKQRKDNMIIYIVFLQFDVSCFFFPSLKLTDLTHKGQKQAHAVGGTGSNANLIHCVLSDYI